MKPEAAIDICRLSPLPIAAAANRLALVTSGSGALYDVKTI